MIRVCFFLASSCVTAWAVFSLGQQAFISLPYIWNFPPAFSEHWVATISQIYVKPTQACYRKCSAIITQDYPWKNKRASGRKKRFHQAFFITCNQWKTQVVWKPDESLANPTTAEFHITNTLSKWVMKGFLPLDTNFIRVDTNWVSRLRPRQRLMDCTQTKQGPQI